MQLHHHQVPSLLLNETTVTPEALASAVATFYAAS